MRPPRRSGALVLATALGIAAGRPVLAQNPDLMLTQEQRDSILATYDNIFPIWGRQAIERGFELPRPLGINLIGVYVDQGIDIAPGAQHGDDPPSRSRHHVRQQPVPDRHAQPPG
jgi:hypothetical protein